MIAHRNSFLEKVLDGPASHLLPENPNWNAGLRAVLFSLFTNMDEISSTKKKCLGVKLIVLPTLSLIRRSLVTSRGGSKLRILLAETDFAVNLARLMNSPHLMESDAAASTILISIASMQELFPELLPQYAVAVFDVIVPVMSEILEKSHAHLGKYGEVFRACLPWTSSFNLVVTSPKFFLPLPNSFQKEMVVEAVLNAIEGELNKNAQADVPPEPNNRDGDDTNTLTMMMKSFQVRD
jgi:hypothetical protein